MKIRGSLAPWADHQAAHPAEGLEVSDGGARVGDVVSTVDLLGLADVVLVNLPLDASPPRCRAWCDTGEGQGGVVSRAGGKRLEVINERMGLDGVR